MIAKRLQLILVVTLALTTVFLTTHIAKAQAVPTAIGVDQAVVRVLEGNWQTLAPGAQHWYRFDYAGDQLPLRISLDMNVAQSAEFQLWTDDQFSRLAIDSGATPVAAGAADPNDAMHLVWQGTLAEAGTYYIVVRPTAGAATSASYLLTIGGRGLAPGVDGGAIVSGALNVNVRSGPSTAYSVLRTVPQGTQLDVLGQDASSDWLLVRLPDGNQGWIARYLTGFTGAAALVAAPALTQPPLAPPSVTAPAAPAAPTSTSVVNVRSGPAESYAVIYQAPVGAVFTVLGQSAAGDWLGVRFANGVEGWIARELTDFSGTAATVATQAAAQPPLAPPATLDTGSVQIVGAFNVNLRAGPSMQYPVLRTMVYGSQLSVLGQDSSSDWLLVQLADGTQGWVARFLTNFGGSVAVIAAPPLVPQPVVITQGTVIQPPLAPPATVDTAPAPAPSTVTLPSQAAAVSNFPIEQSLDNNWRILAGGSTQWYTFSHPGDAQEVQVWMTSDPTGAAEFRVFSEEDARSIMDGGHPDDFAAIGRGTHNENEPADLFWRGAFEEHGRYYVMVRNGSTNDIRFTIFGVGPSIGG